MKIYHVYVLATGQFTGQAFSADGPQAVMANTPEGHGAAEGVTDWQAQRFDAESQAVVPWQPPAPADTDLQTWAWQADIARWVPSRTDAALAMAARADRDARLTACDWVITRATELGEPVPAPWLAYRAALRNVPEQGGFPHNVDWPVPPET